MISDIGTINTDGPKPLKGVGIVIAGEQADGSKKVFGIVFAANTEKLEDVIKTLASGNITINRADYRPGVITLEKP